MIPRANITAWRAKAPWPDDAQVEQDLVLTRALIELFRDPTIRETLSLRGGTALHKFFFNPPGRYSEDIDLVQRKAGGIGPILDSIRGVLDPWLGKPRSDRNRGIVTLLYRFETTGLPARKMRVKVEINTREHFALLGIPMRELKADNPWFSGSEKIPMFELEEMLATKLRALYQRKKGRDLYDLWRGLDLLNDSEAEARIVACFLSYMEHGAMPVSRARMEENLEAKIRDAAFLGDMAPLLPVGALFDPVVAMALVLEKLIEKMPGAPWMGRKEA